MRYLALLLLGILLGMSQSDARVAHHADGQQSYAKSMVQELNSMSALLNAVHSKSAADAAAPQLLNQYKEFRILQMAAEGQPPMSDTALRRHLGAMDCAMNDFRISCARLVQEKFYGSTALGKAVKKIARDF